MNFVIYEQLIRLYSKIVRKSQTIDEMHAATTCQLIFAQHKAILSSLRFEGSMSLLVRDKRRFPQSDFKIFKKVSFLNFILFCPS